MSAYGVPHQLITSAQQISPQAIEEIAQLIEQRGLRTPISQLVGYQQVKANTSILASNIPVTTTSNAWTVTGLGSSTSGLRAGQYLVFISAVMKNSSAFEATMLGIRINSGDPFVAGAGVHGSGTTAVIVEGSAVGAGVLTGVSTLAPVTLTEDPNTIQPIWFVSGGTGTITNYTITLVRLGFAPGASF